MEIGRFMKCALNRCTVSINRNFSSSCALALRSGTISFHVLLSWIKFVDIPAAAVFTYFPFVCRVMDTIINIQCCFFLDSMELWMLWYCVRAGTPYFRLPRSVRFFPADLLFLPLFCECVYLIKCRIETKWFAVNFEECKHCFQRKHFQI